MITYHEIDKIPVQFVEEAKFLYENHKREFKKYITPIPFSVDGTEYTIEIKKDELYNCLQYVADVTAKCMPPTLYFDMAEAIEKVCEEYPNDDPDMQWNDEYERIPGYVIPWESTDEAVNALYYELEDGSELHIEPLSAEQIRFRALLPVQMMIQLLSDADTMHRLIGKLPRDKKGNLKEGEVSIFTAPLVCRHLYIAKLYISVKQNNRIVLVFRSGYRKYELSDNQIAAHELDYYTYQRAKQDLAVSTDLIFA